MRLKEGAGVQRNLKGITGCVIGGILETVGSLSPTLSSSRLETDPTFTFGIMCGAKVPMKYSFPKLYSIAHNKEALVSNYLVSSGSSIHLNPSFIRAVQDWELESPDSFLNLL
jgi:hypothetical protein